MPLDGVRLTLHVLAAALWVGGQFTVAGLLPTVRSFGDDAPKAVAGALARLLWPAYAVLVITGLWNVSALDVSGAPAAWKAVLVAKIVVVAAAGIAVLAHQRTSDHAGQGRLRSDRRPDLGRRPRPRGLPGWLTAPVRGCRRRRSSGRCSSFEPHPRGAGV